MCISFSEKKRFVILLKFAQREHLEAFRSQGLLYMNTTDYFRIIEDDPVRSDRFEGTDRIIQPLDIGTMSLTCNVTGQVINFNPSEIVGPVLFHFSRNLASNIFCMYSINRPTDLFPIDDRNIQFGDSFVMVLNTTEFIRRFCVAAKSLGRPFRIQAVDYFDPLSHSGETGIFRKSSEFSYQNEYRFAIQTGFTEPLKLYIGDVSDITTDIHRSVDIKNALNFSADEARRVGLTW